MQVCRERNLKGTGLSAWLFDSHTGEILDKKVPDKVTSNSSDGQSYDEDAVFDALKEACPVDYATGENLKIKKSSDGASYEVSFNTSDGEFFYNFDKETLEVLEKREPETITNKDQAGAESADIMETAITKCCEYADTNPGEVKDIKIKEVGSGDSKTYQVTFVKDEKNYSLVFDPVSGKVTEK